MKVCSKCGLNKPELDFNLNAHAPGGIRADCKVCTAARSQKRRNRNKKEDIDLYRSKQKNFGKLYEGRHPERAKAQRIIHDVIRTGMLERGACEVCGEINAEAHHDDYSKPKEIRWLCVEHHREHHRKEKRGLLG